MSRVDDAARVFKRATIGSACADAGTAGGPTAEHRCSGEQLGLVDIRSPIDWFGAPSAVSNCAPLSLPINFRLAAAQPLTLNYADTPLTHADILSRHNSYRPQIAPRLRRSAQRYRPRRSGDRRPSTLTSDVQTIQSLAAVATLKIFTNTLTVVGNDFPKTGHRIQRCRRLLASAPREHRATPRR